MSDSSSDPYNRGGLYAFLFTMVFSFAFFIWVSFIHPGVDLKEVPEMNTEGGTQMAGKAAAKKVDVASLKDLWMESEDLVSHGEVVYKANCAVCHGNSGIGDGPAGSALVPPPRNLVEGKWQVGGDRISLYKTFKDGIEGTSMAAFGHLPKADRWALVHYVRSITENKVKDSDSKAEKFAASAE